MSHGTLEDRMKKHTPGQITWPSLTLNQRCEACRHFDTGEERQIKGRCELVRLHQKVNGKQYNGQQAMACPKFENGSNWKRLA